MQKFPTKPGVYLMKNKKGEVLYVGKAKNLKKRLTQYFQKTALLPVKVQKFLKKVDKIDWIITDTEKEALLLENIQIKKYKPTYNVIFKDDKNFISLEIDLTEDFPRLTRVRKRENKKAIYFGPYSSSFSLSKTLEELTKIFRPRNCSTTNFKNRVRPCLNFQIKRCYGPCCNHISKDDYRKIINQIIRFLKGDAKALIKDLEKEMKKASESEDFEKAGERRDKVLAIKQSLEAQKIIMAKGVLTDVIGYYTEQERSVITLFNIKSGVLDDIKHYKIDEAFSREVLEEFISQHYEDKDMIPDEILLPEKIEYKVSLEMILTDRRKGYYKIPPSPPLPKGGIFVRSSFSKGGRKVIILFPQKGDNKRLVTLANKNAASEFVKKSYKEDENILEQIKNIFHLKNTPHLIECFDISNIQGKFAVGAKIAFLDGKPHKDFYRRYKIRIKQEPDDYLMMKEVLERRLKNKKEKFPDLILIDGGRGHLNVGIQVCANLDITKINLISIAKGEKEKADFFFVPNRKNPIFIKPHVEAYKLLYSIRNEAHRFAISYHKKLREKNIENSALDNIPGIGPKIKNKLLSNFKDISEIKKASIKEIVERTGINKKVAIKIKTTL